MSDVGSQPPARSPIAPPTAPGNRVRPGLVVAIAIAALMVLGFIGLVAAALLGSDDHDPTGNGLGPTVNVDEPATAPPATGAAVASGSDDVDGAAAAESSEQQDSSGPASGAGDDFSGESPTTAATLPPIETALAVNEIEEPDEDDLPALGTAPVELPPQVTAPAPPSTFAAVPFGEFVPDAVPELDEWSVTDRSGDRLTLSDGDQVIDIFLIDGVATADEALEQFYDDVKPELEELTRSPITRMGAPSSRFISVAGSEYLATSAGQQGSSTMTGAIVAGVRPDGTAVIVTSSRAGTSSTDELANDAGLLSAIIAHL